MSADYDGEQFVLFQCSHWIYLEGLTDPRRPANLRKGSEIRCVSCQTETKVRLTLTRMDRRIFIEERG